MRSSQFFSQTPTPRQLNIEPGMSLFVQASPNARLVCESGEAQLSQSIMWVGTLPVQISQALQPGESCAVESRGWLRLQASTQGACLRLEPPPRNAFLSRLSRGLHALMHAHNHGGAAAAR